MAQEGDVLVLPAYIINLFSHCGVVPKISHSLSVAPFAEHTHFVAVAPNGV